MARGSVIFTRLSILAYGMRMIQLPTAKTRLRQIETLPFMRTKGERVRLLGFCIDPPNCQPISVGLRLVSLCVGAGRSTTVLVRTVAGAT